MSELLPIAVRVYTEATRLRRRLRSRKRRGSKWRLPTRVLVFDCETETDAGQTLTFGSYRYCRLADDRLELIEEGLFYADDLPARRPDGFATLADYAARQGLALRSRRQFVDDVFWPCAYHGRAWVVGFNLPFDVSRLAVAFGAARGIYAGGHSLVLWQYQLPDGTWVENRYRPRVLIKSLDSKRDFIAFGSQREPDADDQIPDGSPDGEPNPTFRFRGHFLDLRTLAFALTNQGHSLASACETFGVEQRKLQVAEHGAITPEYIDYNRRDVTATGLLFEKLLSEYRRHPIHSAPTKAYSPASVAKAYLRALGVQPLLERQPDFPRQVLGAGMVGYYGGRSECRIRRTPTPVVYVDFLSMYATVNTLMHAWRLLIADHVEIADTTDTVRALLSRLTLEQCFEPAFWPDLLTLVQVKPDGQPFPVRADYGENGQWQIGNNPLTSDTPLWYPLADVVAAVLRSPIPAEVIRAVQLVPVGQQDGLQPVQLGGDINVDPARDDFFATLIEQRKLIQQNSELPESERERLNAFLKVLANSGCYGIFAEINSNDLGTRTEPVTIHGLFDPFSQRVHTVETPGSYSFPPLAACITGAARLMLALIERLVTDAGGNWVFCDTDSMAIVSTQDGGTVPCPGGQDTTPDERAGVRALSWNQVDEIIGRFAALNPYNPDLVPGSILELEQWNRGPVTDERLQLYCYAISAKRYALYNLTDDGQPILRKFSEHGLGHLLNPTDPDSDDRDWIAQLWQRILDDVHPGHGHEEIDDWLDLPAVGRISASTAAALHLFHTYNADKPPLAQVKPYNFLLCVHVAPFGHPAGYPPERFQLIHPYEPDPRRWLQLEWIDRYSGHRFPIHTAGPPSPHSVKVKTYRDVLDLYRTQPEPKSLDSQGHPCSRRSVGLLTRRPVSPSEIAYIGKEANRLEETTAGVVHDVGEILTTYTDPQLDPWRTLVIPTLRSFNTAEIAQRARLDRRTIQRHLNHTSFPRRGHRLTLTAVAVQLATEELMQRGLVAPRAALATLKLFIDSPATKAAPCPVCGTPPSTPRATYCSPACKKRAYRARRNT